MTTPESQLKTRVREAWHEAWDKGNVDALDGLLADDFARTTQGSDTSQSAASTLVMDAVPHHYHHYRYQLHPPPTL